MSFYYYQNLNFFKNVQTIDLELHLDMISFIQLFLIFCRYCANIFSSSTIFHPVSKKIMGKKNHILTQKCSALSFGEFSNSQRSHACKVKRYYYVLRAINVLSKDTFISGGCLRRCCCCCCCSIHVFIEQKFA